MRNLASIQRITALHPIEGKDRIVLANVLGWQVIVRKGEYQVGDLCVYVEIDSIMPEKPEFEFLRPKNFRVKTMKMGGVLSQGICFPLSILPHRPYEIGEDVTNLIGVTKYDEYEDEPVQQKKKSPFRNFLFSHKLTRPLGRLIYGAKKNKGDFPDFIAKTDETRIQNMPNLFSDEEAKRVGWVGREKIDGQSGTFYVKKLKKPLPIWPQRYEFGVCSRNRRLPTPDNSSYWQVARKYNIESTLINLLENEFASCDYLVLQGEVVGPKIQGNKYGLNETDLYCFNLITPDRKIFCAEAEYIVGEFGLKWAPLVYAGYRLPDTVDEVLADADGMSSLAPVLREGIVFRSYRNGDCISFKAVSNQFLLKHKL